MEGPVAESNSRSLDLIEVMSNDVEAGMSHLRMHLILSELDIYLNCPFCDQIDEEEMLLT